MKRISFEKARKFYDKGEDIFFIPNGQKLEDFTPKLVLKGNFDYNINLIQKIYNHLNGKKIKLYTK